MDCLSQWIDIQSLLVRWQWSQIITVFVISKKNEKVNGFYCLLALSIFHSFLLFSTQFLCLSSYLSNSLSLTLIFSMILHRFFSRKPLLITISPSFPELEYYSLSTFWFYSWMIFIGKRVYMTSLSKVSDHLVDADVELSHRFNLSFFLTIVKKDVRCWVLKIN